MPLTDLTARWPLREVSRVEDGQPLSHGATYVVASDTKALSGHSDLVLGHVATSDPDQATALRTWRTQHGAVPGSMEVWLAHRSLATLPLRLTQQCRSAQQLGRRCHQ